VEILVDTLLSEVALAARLASLALLSAGYHSGFECGGMLFSVASDERWDGRGECVFVIPECADERASRPPWLACRSSSSSVQVIRIA
jgi:hypothetical protein